MKKYLLLFTIVFAVYQSLLLRKSSSVINTKLCNQYGARVILICTSKKVKGKFVPKRVTLD